MKPPAAPASPSQPAPDVDDRVTGLPLLRSWTGVYLFVLGTFALWIILLVAVTRMFA